MPSKIKKTKYDNRYINDDTDFIQLSQSILDDYDNIYENVRLKNMDIYGVRGSRTIRNKKLQIKKSLEKYRDTGYCSPSLKSFIALTYNIEENKMYHQEEMENYEEYEDVYNDITKHGSYDAIHSLFILHSIADAVSNNPDEYIKLKKERDDAILKSRRIEIRMARYMKFVSLPMESMIEFKCPKTNSIRTGRKITNTFYGKSKRKIELQTIGKIIEKIDIDTMRI